MKTFYRLSIRLTGIALICTAILNGCAATYQSDEQEGGITGTGAGINCEEEQNKKRKECLGEM
jgi:uncharacterized protein YceK